MAIAVGTTAAVLANRGTPNPSVAPAAGSSTAATFTAATFTAATSTAARTVTQPTTVAAPPPPAASKAPVSTRPESAELVARGHFTALDVQQTHPCATQQAVPRAELRLLAKGVTISKVASCRIVTSYVTGHGVRSSTQINTVAPTDLPALTRELTAGDRPPGNAVACNRPRLELDFVVYLADGHVVRPGAPVDGCSVSGRLTNILQGAGFYSEQSDSTTLPDGVSTTGCRPGNAVAEPFSSAAPGGDTLGLPAGERLSVCWYSYDSATGSIRLTKVGSVTANLAGGDTVVPSKKCASSDVRAPAVGGFVAFVTPPQRPVTTRALAAVQTRLFVELGGCHRMLTGDGMVMDWAPQRIIDVIASTPTTTVPVTGG